MEPAAKILLSEVGGLFLKIPPEIAVTHPAFASAKTDTFFNHGAVRLYLFCDGMIFTDRVWIATVQPEHAVDFCLTSSRS